MTARASLFGLALDGLRRKLGRNLLTMSGVFIGVLSLTLIVALGQGMALMVTDAISGGSSLRQISLSPGFGHRLRDEPESEISGEMTDARRLRLRRAARMRLRPAWSLGRRAETFDRATLEEIATLPHVASVVPIVVERYRLRFLDHETNATATVGVDVGHRRLEGRIIAGRYLSSPDAREVLLHEYLAYQWGYRTVESLGALIGGTLRLETIANRRSPFAPSPEMIAGVLGRADMSKLTLAERAALPGIVEKLSRSLDGGEEAPVRTHEMTVVGVVRELTAHDTVSIIEDGNARQVDVFLPDRTAVELFLESPVNRELGFSRALVTVDDAAHARKVETVLRDRGHAAFSVASALARFETRLAAVTLVISFLTGIALVVAALGIVNTMVTSVVERTGEIGLWKAVGATSAQVRGVFVLEAGMIGMIGGLLGLGAALLLTLPGDALASRLLAERSTLPFTGGVFHVPHWLALGGPGLATAVAVLASLYPASRAARVDPVTALRHD